jgi:predicted Zn-dependent protease
MKAPLYSQANRISLLIAALLCWASLSLTSKAYALSIEDEWKMGQEFFLQVSSQYQLVSDPFACKYINDLGHYLLAPLETKPFPFHFYIINDRHPQRLCRTRWAHFFLFRPH